MPGRKRLLRSTKPIFRHSVIAEMENQADRAAALIGAAFVESTLAMAISDHCPEPAAARKLLKGPLASFGAKITAAHALLLIGPIATQDLENISRIRNAFAHEFVTDLSFTRPEISQICKQLHYGSPDGRPARAGEDRFRRRFLDTVIRIEEQIAKSLQVREDGTTRLEAWNPEPLVP